MNKRFVSAKFINYSLGALLLFVALNAFGGGYYAMAGAAGVPVEWLAGSPFQDYYVPGLFLFVIVGGSALFAGILVFARHHIARKAAIACGMVILLWLLVQLSIIGYVSWMQPVTAAAALIIILLTLKIPRYGY
ncbi:MAG: hypothetical protein ACTHM5_06085 [Ginsengibacter sp.]